MPTLSGILTLILSTLLVFIIVNLTNNAFNIQIISIIIAVYILSIIFKKSNKIFLVFLLNSSLLLLLEKTGGLHSPLFFLSFFSSFVIAFLLPEGSVFIFFFTTALFFLPALLKQLSFNTILPLFSLFLLSPLAYFSKWNLNQKKENEEKQSIDSILSAIDVLKKNSSLSKEDE